MATRVAAAMAGGSGSSVALPTLLVGSNPGTVDAPPARSRVVKGPQFGFSGVTRNAAGAALGGVTVKLVRTVDDGVQDVTVSDAAGNYSFNGANAGYTYYLVAYLAGAPDVAGTTLNTLIGA